MYFIFYVPCGCSRLRYRYTRRILHKFVNICKEINLNEIFTVIGRIFDEEY